ncbi:cytochrome P450 3A30-like isoform X1 [Girardinichthys multiradiatus]|uniref:cytochrome P450 3A30-like isoform X1 n=2 Tax=Girardinichthys multiradiatus TaxID=208333 RepID=UPI001FAB5B82|nr:cytochrome P450 3A30-like isoform X1 [Girardinichthys multiradiatus]
MGFLPFFSFETWILLISFVFIFVLYGHWTFGVFEKLGIPGPKPMMYWGTVNRYNQVYYLDDNECAKKYGRVWGSYELRRPMLAVMDPEMLKIILVKECFTFFTNRRNFRLNGDLYDAVNIAEDDQWRRIRNHVTPSFTSGRIKEMFSIMQHHSHKLLVRLQSKMDNKEVKVITIKDIFGPYSMDVMANCVFSVDLDSINEPSNPFITHASKILRFPVPLFLFQGCFPIFLPLLELLGLSLFPKSSTTFFRAVVEKIRAERNESSRKNLADILQNFINYQTNKLGKERENQGLNDHEILSQVTMLLFAGYETSATTLAFLAYTLARHPEVMKRLQQEIDLTFPQKGPIQYDGLMQMEYLSSVVDECLRLYPPAAHLERMTKETVKVKGITIPKNMIVMIPVYALHRDPELWPDPEEFKPDRFSKENKQGINPYAYLPFGIGPRNCLGMRFAVVMIKLALVKVLQNYNFLICEETEIPLKMHPEGLVGPLQPIKLKLQKRSFNSADEEN